MNGMRLVSNLLITAILIVAGNFCVFLVEGDHEQSEPHRGLAIFEISDMQNAHCEVHAGDIGLVPKETLLQPYSACITPLITPRDSMLTGDRRDDSHELLSKRTTSVIRRC